MNVDQYNKIISLLEEIRDRLGERCPRPAAHMPSEYTGEWPPPISTTFRIELADYGVRWCGREDSHGAHRWLSEADDQWSDCNGTDVQHKSHHGAPCCDAEPGQPHTGDCRADLPRDVCPGCGLWDCDADHYRRAQQQKSDSACPGVPHRKHTKSGDPCPLDAQHSHYGVAGGVQGGAWVNEETGVPGRYTEHKHAWQAGLCVAPDPADECSEPRPPVSAYPISP